MFSKKLLNIGAELPVDVLYKNHHIIKKHFKDIIISVEDLDIDNMVKVFKNFGTYNIYVKSPSYLNVYNAKKSDSFSKTMQFYKGLLKVSGIDLKGVIIDMGKYGDVTPEYADNIFKNIFLKKLVLEYARNNKVIILRNTAKSFIESFNLSYILSTVRGIRNKRLVVGLDTERSHYLNAGFLKDGVKERDLGRLKKEFKYVFLSGIGKKGDRAPLFECKVYSEYAYVNLVKGLRDSTFFIEYKGDLQKLIGIKDRIKTLAE